MSLYLALFADSVELMVTGDFFDQRVAIVFKQDEVPHAIQKQLRIEEAANDFLQLVFQQRPIVFVLDRIPRHESFFVGRQRTDSRRNPIADDQSHVVGQQVGDFVFVSLQLRVREVTSRSQTLHAIFDNPFWVKPVLGLRFLLLQGWGTLDEVDIHRGVRKI